MPVSFLLSFMVVPVYLVSLVTVAREGHVADEGPVADPGLAVGIREEEVVLPVHLPLLMWERPAHRAVLARDELRLLRLRVRLPAVGIEAKGEVAPSFGDGLRLPDRIYASHRVHLVMQM